MGNSSLATMNAGSVDVLSQDEIDLVRQTYAAELTDTEFRLVIAEGNSLGLSALQKEIVGIKFKGRMSTFVTQKGVRKLVSRNPNIQSVRGPFFCGKDGVFREVWLDEAPPAAAKFEVLRADSEHWVSGIAVWKERSQTFWDKDARCQKLMPTWAAMPSLMLGKVAETDAYKRARLIADDLNIRYEDDEEVIEHDDTPVMRRRTAMKRLHGAGNARGLDHDGVRSVVAELRPGIESLNDPDVDPIDMETAADVISGFEPDVIDQVIHGEVELITDENGPNERELWRIHVREILESADVDEVRGLAARAKEFGDAWRFEDLIELAPTVANREYWIKHARAAGLSPTQIEAAHKRRAETSQVRSAARQRNEPTPLFETGNDPDSFTR